MKRAIALDGVPVADPQPLPEDAEQHIERLKRDLDVLRAWQQAQQQANPSTPPVWAEPPLPVPQAQPNSGIPNGGTITLSGTWDVVYTEPMTTWSVGYTNNAVAEPPPAPPEPLPTVAYDASLATLAKMRAALAEQRALLNAQRRESRYTNNTKGWRKDRWRY